MLKKLRLKFICITMVIVTVLLCAIFGLILHFTSNGLAQNNIKTMEMDSKKPEPHDKADHNPRGLHFSITRTPDGILLVKGDQSEHYDDSDYLHLWNVAMTSGEKTGIIKDYALRFLIQPDHQSIRFEDISGELEAIDALWRSCSLIGVCLWLIMLGFSIILANWAIRPVEKAWEQQRQFVADASHELKTPLTVIMTNAELLDSADFDHDTKSQSLHSILAMSRQMRHLVEGMLELARADSGTPHTHFEKIDLTSLLADAILPFDALFFEKELTLSTDIASGISVHGSETHLKQIVEILLDNAQKYSQAPGQVSLQLETRGKHAILRLETPGTPLSKADQKHIFDRFYRVDRARSRTGSYGLGLSIAQQIVHTHHGKIWAEATDHSNIFYVQLPTV